jgi:hypothetical protein
MSVLDPARPERRRSYGPPLRGVLVDQCGADAVVSHPRLKIGEAGACLRGQGISGRAEVMKVQTGDAGTCDTGWPAGIAAEVAASQHPAECSGEDQGRGLLGDVGLQVLGQGLSDPGRDGNDPEASAGLRRADRVPGA